MKAATKAQNKKVAAEAKFKIVESPVKAQLNTLKIIPAQVQQDTVETQIRVIPTTLKILVRLLPNTTKTATKAQNKKAAAEAKLKTAESLAKAQLKTTARVQQGTVELQVKVTPTTLKMVDRLLPNTTKITTRAQSNIVQERTRARPNIAMEARVRKHPYMAAEQLRARLNTLEAPARPQTHINLMVKLAAIGNRPQLAHDQVLAMAILLENILDMGPRMLQRDPHPLCRSSGSKIVRQAPVEWSCNYPQIP
jgi:hypothetical protein